MLNAQPTVRTKPTAYLPDFDREAAAEWARGWLFDSALPLWWSEGADHEAGGFFERIDMTGTALQLPKRVRVQARQTFVYAAAGRLGWSGPWHEAVDHGVRHLLAAYRRTDGLFAITPDRVEGDRATSVDLYDQAFVLLALAAGWNALGKPDRLLGEATRLIKTLEDALAHPVGGYRESALAARLRSNPHMHLLEALLAWIQLGVRDPFEQIARRVIDLALTRMIDPATGAVGEYFSAHWERLDAAEGTIREPGHQFEWAYLLRLGAHLLSLDLGASIARLEQFGAEHGVRDGRIIFSTDSAGAAVDRSSRLWAQTEALRAYAISPELSKPGDTGLADRFTTVRRFLDDSPVPGLWRERANADGGWLDEPAPASSLYHIVTGFAPLLADRHATLLALL